LGASDGGCAGLPRKGSGVDQRERWETEIFEVSKRLDWGLRGFQALRTITLVGTATVAVLASVGKTSADAAGWQTATLVVSLILAIATAFDQVLRPGSRWRSKKEYRESLVNAAWDLVNAQGRYGDGDERSRFGRFQEDVERLLREYHKGISDLVRETGTSNSGS
ncbi:MAG: DUF4231 domain-containing protein, partial [Ilumatobacteraceae bacterium]